MTKPADNARLVPGVVEKNTDAAEIEATWLDDDGRGVGLQDGLEVHVADLLPGERAAVTIEHRSPHRPVAWAARATDPYPRSPNRVNPACPAAGSCGGCAWQHCAYPAQLAAKRARVERVLAHVFPQPPQVAPVIGAPSTTGYRSRAKYVVAHNDTGQLMLGAYKPRTHQVVDTSGCRVVVPAIAAAVEPIRRALEATGLAPYDEATGHGDLRYVVARTGSDGGLLVGLVTAADTPRAPMLAAAQALVPAHATGAVWVRNPARSGTILAGEIEPLAGAPTVRDSYGDTQVELDIAAFTQINRAAADHMYQALRDTVPPWTRAVDLYCGAGAIAFHLAGPGRTVVGIERSDAAVAVASRAAATTAHSVSFRALAAEAAGDAVRTLSPELIIVNPPRKGLGRGVVELLASAAPRTIVYVSCGPASLARDLGVLADHGYAVDRVQPFDLMPGTAQVETLCLLSRRPR